MTTAKTAVTKTVAAKGKKAAPATAGVKRIVDEYAYDFPAVLGSQGDTPTLLINVPARIIKNLLSADNYGHVLERSQRELNKKRAMKFFEYLRDALEAGKPFIIPPLVGNCSGDYTFENFNDSPVGRVRLPMDSEIKLFDGQHRAVGIIELCRHYELLGLSVPILLTMNLPLETRQQFFSDINNNASKPAAAINMAYNGRDDVAQTVIRFLKNHTLFSKITDFEHNVVPAKSDFFLSFKAIADATAKFIGEGEKRLSNEDVQGIWEAWAMFSGINEIHGTTAQAEYKKEYIQFHAVLIIAFGYAVAQLLHEKTAREVIMLIEKLSVETELWQRELYFLIKSWDGICVDASKERPVVTPTIAAQKAAGNRLAQVILRQVL